MQAVELRITDADDPHHTRIDGAFELIEGGAAFAYARESHGKIVGRHIRLGVCSVTRGRGALDSSSHIPVMRQSPAARAIALADSQPASGGRLSPQQCSRCEHHRAPP
jgi:hypothetical protein